MSMSDASGWGWPGTSFAMKIAPAHVPHTGMPWATRSLSLSMIPYWLASLPIVVLSPPGMISASISSSCSGRRTSRPSTPSRSSVARCSAKSPWRPRTPARAVRTAALLPAATGKSFSGGDRVQRQAAQRLAETARDLGDELRVAEMRRRLDDRLCAPRRIRGLEDPRANEVPFGAELHHQRRVRRRRDTARAEEHDREPPGLRDLADELDGNAELVRLRLELGVELRRGHLMQLGDGLGDRADVPHGLDDVAGARLALASDHRRSFVDPPQRFAELARAADARRFDVVLVHVVRLV